ncbi:MAG: PLP-dependent transferase, partial [Gemmatimonadetes bacterium]|nr:PLP-dependent transferase [Gemmatimonadota bacterium]
VAGSVAGPAEWVRRIKVMHDHLGGALDPHAAFLLERGLKTLDVRVRRQNETAARLARLLDAHDAVSVVSHPSLESHPQHERAARLFDGFGGMISFELHGGLEAAESFLAEVRLPTIAASLGGAESLMVRPAAAIHSGLTREEREKSGVSDGLIRFSVGLEAVEDLEVDLSRALAAAMAATPV